MNAREKKRVYLKALALGVEDQIDWPVTDEEADLYHEQVESFVTDIVKAYGLEKMSAYNSGILRDEIENHCIANNYGKGDEYLIACSVFEDIAGEETKDIFFQLGDIEVEFFDNCAIHDEWDVWLHPTCNTEFFKILFSKTVGV